MQDIEQHCTNCGRVFFTDDLETWWDENGTTSVKLCRCPKCGRIHVIKYESYCFEDINNDDRLF